ncbi:MAG: sodium:proton antiporter [Myxococcota bacterium]|jgi:multisubunit Na+/H+ antiporter MnhC subunit|nr:sodium:proton antiporter [Myxococcota bacterium]
MIWIIAVAVAAVLSAGVYMTLSRDLLRVVIGVSLMAAAANLIVFGAARPQHTAPPIIEEGQRFIQEATPPLPQALVLTAIVIGFSLTCFSLLLVLAIKQRSAHNDSHRLRASEPPSRDDGYPPILDELEEDGASGSQRISDTVEPLDAAGAEEAKR